MDEDLEAPNEATYALHVLGHSIREQNLLEGQPSSSLGKRYYFPCVLPPKKREQQAVDPRFTSTNSPTKHLDQEVLDPHQEDAPQTLGHEVSDLLQEEAAREAFRRQQSERMAAQLALESDIAGEGNAIPQLIPIIHGLGLNGPMNPFEKRLALLLYGSGGLAGPLPCGPNIYIRTFEAISCEILTAINDVLENRLPSVPPLNVFGIDFSVTQNPWGFPGSCVGKFRRGKHDPTVGSVPQLLWGQHPLKYKNKSQKYKKLFTNLPEPRAGDVVDIRAYQGRNDDDRDCGASVYVIKVENDLFAHLTLFYKI